MPSKINHWATFACRASIGVATAFDVVVATFKAVVDTSEGRRLGSRIIIYAVRR
jgi:hypothetical protein